MQKVKHSSMGVTGFQAPLVPRPLEGEEQRMPGQSAA